MARKSERKRMVALEYDSLAYRREVPNESIRADELNSTPPLDEEVVLVGRIMLADRTGKISKLGVFEEISGQQVICLERLESNGRSVPLFLLRNDENIQQVNSSIHYGDVVMVEGVRKELDTESVFLGYTIKLLSKAIGDVHNPDIDFRKKYNVNRYRYMQLLQEPNKLKRLRQCSKILRLLRQELYATGFEEVSLSLLQDNFEAGYANPFVVYSVEKERDMYLRLSSELLMWRMMIAGFSKVFEFGKSFRNQEVSGDKVPQFNLLELYYSYATREYMESLVQRIILEVIFQVHGCLNIPTPKGLIDCSGKWQAKNF